MQLKKFLDIFPPPKFLDLPFTGLVFSDSNIRALSLNRSSLHPELFLEMPLSEGAIEAGIIKKEEEVVKVLQDLRPKLKGPFVKFAVPDEISYVFSASVPVFPGKDASESVSFILEENVPLPLSDISFDFTPIKIERAGQGFKVKVVVTAAASSIIETYIKALRKAQIEPIFCVNESQSIARSIVPKNSSGNSAIIYIHRNVVGIYMTEGEIVEFSSITQIPPNSSPDLFASFVISEFKKSLDYWKGKVFKDKLKINCFLCGKHEECKLIIDRGSDISGISISFGNVWQNAFSLGNYIPEISFEDSLRFAGAVGLFV